MEEGEHQLKRRREQHSVGWSPPPSPGMPKSPLAATRTWAGLGAGTPQLPQAAGKAGSGQEHQHQDLLQEGGVRRDKAQPHQLLAPLCTAPAQEASRTRAIALEDGLGLG